MLVVDRATGALHDGHFRELPDRLGPGDLLVVNNSKVIRARLLGHRRNFTGAVEALLTKRLDEKTWLALVHPGRKIRTGDWLVFPEGVEAEVTGRGSFGERTLRFECSGDFLAALDRIGHVPLPPYMHRPDTALDGEAYQTVYAKQAGSVAAPTAGLHFTEAMFARLRERGVEIAEITLHVGLGTFQPVRAERVEDHRMHAETFEISPASAATIERARTEGRRIVAVGTTSVRVLEHGELTAGAGETSLFVYPGFTFAMTGAMLTNFHLPRSTLLMLVCAFGGKEKILRAYDHAVAHGGYRFYSYGDCMLIV